eukprot:5646-Heterococcus_DN1.PRE.1
MSYTGLSNYAGDHCNHQQTGAIGAAAAATAKRQTVPVPQCSEDLRLLRRCQLPAYLKFCEEVVFCNEDTAQGFAGIAAQHSGHLETLAETIEGTALAPVPPTQLGSKQSLQQLAYGLPDPSADVVAAAAATATTAAAALLAPQRRKKTKEAVKRREQQQPDTGEHNLETAIYQYLHYGACCATALSCVYVLAVAAVYIVESAAGSVSTIQHTMGTDDRCLPATACYYFT